MKARTFLILILICSCGKKKGDSPVAGACNNVQYKGSWAARESASTLTIKSDCSVSDSRCESKAQFQVNEDFKTTGNFKLVINENNQAQDCLPNGTYNCTASSTPDAPNTYLKIQCVEFGGSYLQYDRL